VCNSRDSGNTGGRQKIKEDDVDAKRSMNVDKSRVHSKNKMPATAGSKTGTNVNVDDNSMPATAGTPATKRKFNNSRVRMPEWQGQHGCQQKQFSIAKQQGRQQHKGRQQQQNHQGHQQQQGKSATAWMSESSKQLKGPGKGRHE
jgi:hypothetical protein